jgi:hypothetical protein
MPALPSRILEPLWYQFAALLPQHNDTHPLGCHRRRIPDRLVFDKLGLRPAQPRVHLDAGYDPRRRP